MEDPLRTTSTNWKDTAIRHLFEGRNAFVDGDTPAALRNLDVARGVCSGVLNQPALLIDIRAGRRLDYAKDMALMLGFVLECMAFVGGQMIDDALTTELRNQS